MKLRPLQLLLFALALSGCAHPGYLSQAAAGQWSLLANARPISEVVRTHDEPLHRRQVLSRIHEIRAFGRTRGLNTSRSYRTYVNVRSDAVVWVVQAAPPLSLEPREWSFPLVGSVPYLGFFDRSAAEEYARKLAEAEKLDVHVRGASAYSTLGWFDDPVLSSMIPARPDAMGEFANVILHESVHATVYVNGQSTFNESLASFVGDGLTAQWLTETFGKDDPLTRVWLRYQERFTRRAAQLREAWVRLDAVYESERTDEEKLAEKARIIEALERSLGTPLGTGTSINNALLSGYKTYAAGTQAFERLFAACGKNWPRFLEAVGKLEASDFPEEQAEVFDEVLAKLDCAAQ